MERWTGKVALVTGAGSGIGAAIALTLAQAGMKVVGVDLNQQAVQRLCENLTPGQGSILALKCDLTIDEEVECVFDTIKRKFGGLDVCINNAATTGATKPLLDGTPTDWRHIMNVNVIALCYCSKLAAQSMVERKVEGQIINTCSLTAHMTKIDAVLNFYSATKHAVRFLTEGLRQEMMERKHNIRVACICPGTVNTNMLNTLKSDPELYERIIASKLNPEDIANAVKYILSRPQNVEVNDIIIAPMGQKV